MWPTFQYRNNINYPQDKKYVTGKIPDTQVFLFADNPF